MHYLVKSDAQNYVPSSEFCRILSVLPPIAVPQASATIFRIDFVDNSDEVHVKWLGTLPTKCKL